MAGGTFLSTFIIPSANVKNQQELVNKLDYCLLCSIVCAAVQNIAQRCPLCEVLQLNPEILENNKSKGLFAYQQQLASISNRNELHCSDFKSTQCPPDLDGRKGLI